MNIFSFLLSGASFATSLLAPAQWLIPISQCLPLYVQQQAVWQPAQLSGLVTGQSMFLTPLLQGEVKLTWKIACHIETTMRLDWSFQDQSLMQGVFEQTGYHAQEMNVQHATTYLKAPGEGSITLFIPDVNKEFSFTAQKQESSLPSFELKYSQVFPWRIFENLLSEKPAFFEVRSAVTGYFPQEKDTVPIECHTKGDLLVSHNASSCNLARHESLATQNRNTLYSLKNGMTGAFSPALSSSKPQQPGEVIISEVMWAGSYFNDLSLPSDQWIELYNPTDTLMNLVGARLRGAKPLGDITFFSDFFVPPKGFVIIGKQGYDKTSLVRNPDKIEQLSLPPDGRVIQLLSNKGVILDETPLPPWPAGKDDQTNKIRSSMQRRWLELPGTDPLSWGDCSKQEESFRCAELSKQEWRSSPGQNLGTPWQFSVL